MARLVKLVGLGGQVSQASGSRWKGRSRKRFRVVMLFILVLVGQGCHASQARVSGWSDFPR